MELRTATAEDIKCMYGAPAAVPVSMVVLDNGGPIAIAGIAHLDEGAFAVSWIKDEAKDSPKAILRAARVVRQMIEALGEPVYARNDADEPTADRFLRHIGFVRQSGPEETEGLYVYSHPATSRR